MTPPEPIAAPASPEPVAPPASPEPPAASASPEPVDGPALARNGGDLVVETLTALGTDVLFGIPGQHALGLFDALSRHAGDVPPDRGGSIRLVASRTENNAAFAADGYARATGRPGVMFVSTGPGALTALAGLQEAYATSVPIVLISSQIPRAGLGGRRKGFLHQLDDQRRSAENVVKHSELVEHAAGIVPALQRAWRTALTAPQGPVWVEITQDTLLEPTVLPPVADVSGAPEPLPARAELLDLAAQWLAGAERPVILAGGGVRRGRAEAELLAVAEAVRAPVVCTPGGKGAFDWQHPLSAQSWVEDVATTELLADADVLLVIGTSLGEVTSNYFTLRPRGRIVQIDATARVLESNFPALGIHADAKLALAGLAERLQPRASDGRAEDAVETLLEIVEGRLDGQDLAHERGVLGAIRAALPDDAQTFWDMTIAGYWAWSCWDPRSGEFHSAQGAGGIGWAYGAALGAAVGLGRRVLAVNGDGGAMYGIGELAVARQHNLPVTWLIVDDGGYGILREYMTDAFGAPTATELVRPDFAALAEAFGVPATVTTPETLREDLVDAWLAEGPNVVVLPTRLAMFAATHLGT
ncbi:thiamine pyrophosphate-binding protein [Microlunatus ginsengisoli]|uniref:Thiamine pyrophosphate-binding protein n=1 Tax=Microlunatus ginsengisoli TaxID=363863 RepID=A0ABP7AIQ2_9ACTN